MTDYLSNTEILFIRAANVGIERVRKVYNRFYIGSDVSARDDLHISSILIGICEDWMPINTYTLVYLLNPARHKLSEEYYPTVVCEALMSHIRSQPVGVLPGFIPPVKNRAKG